MIGDSWCGRPKRYIRRRAIVSLPPFPYLRSPLPTNAEYTLGDNAALPYDDDTSIHLPHTCALPPWRQPSRQLGFCDGTTPAHVNWGPIRSPLQLSSGNLEETTFVTSRRCTAVSIDTRIAVARFPGQFFGPTHSQVGVPLGFVKPLSTLTCQNFGAGMGRTFFTYHYGWGEEITS